MLCILFQITVHRENEGGGRGLRDYRGLAWDYGDFGAPFNHLGWFDCVPKGPSGELGPRFPGPYQKHSLQQEKQEKAFTVTIRLHGECHLAACHGPLKTSVCFPGQQPSFCGETRVCRRLCDRRRPGRPPATPRFHGSRHGFARPTQCIYSLKGRRSQRTDSSHKLLLRSVLGSHLNSMQGSR